MTFNKKYLAEVLEQKYGFKVQRDSTGLAFNAFHQGTNHQYPILATAAELEVAWQQGLVSLIEGIEAGNIRNLTKKRHRGTDGTGPGGSRSIRRPSNMLGGPG